ncbi:MAG: hypothetical protein NY202_01575 [Mollicutes bacterium UO1]
MVNSKSDKNVRKSLSETKKESKKRKSVLFAGINLSVLPQKITTIAKTVNLSKESKFSECDDSGIITKPFLKNVR